MHAIFELDAGDVRAEPRERAALEERVVNEGLRGRWYAVTGSRSAGATPSSITAFGERLVLWRDSGGTVHLQADRCPHRGARLSQGWVSESHIVCPYHGVRIDGEGTIAAVPALPGCPLVGRHGVLTYATRELAGAIFAYFPSPAQPEPVGFEPPPEFLDGEWSHFLCETEWACNYRYALENVLDPMHGSYLHGNSFTLQYGSREDTMRVDETAHGFIVSRNGQTGVNFDWTEFADTGMFWCRLDIPYPPGGGPGGPFRILGLMTPIDERNARIFFWRLRRVSGWQRDLWRFLYRDRLEERHWNVLEQDRIALEGLPDDARDHEMLYQHDIGVTRLRKILKTVAREQIAATVAIVGSDRRAPGPEPVAI